MKLVTSLTLLAAALVAAAPAAADACADDPALCASARPLPSISASPSAPRIGSPVVLEAGAQDGSALAWDLDGDGVYDDATGRTVTTTLSGATPLVGVRETDRFGRSSTETVTFVQHAFNAAPGGQVAFSPPSARVGTPVTVTAQGWDDDGRIAQVALDLDGDGTYETPGAEHTATYATAGTRTIGARFTDDAGATATAGATIGVHAENLLPRVSLQLAQADGSFGIGAPLVAGGATVTAYGSDPDGTVAGFDFDLDGDGTYEQHAAPGSALPPGIAGVAHTSFAAGVHEIGVRVTDSDGGSSTLRQSVLAVPEWPLTGPHAPPVVPMFAGLVARPGVPVTLSAAALEGGVTYAWDADGDGAFDDGSGAQVHFAYPAAGEYTARVKATSAGGERTAWATVTVRAAPALPPVLSLRLPHPARAGRALAFDASGRSAEGVEHDVPLAFDLDGDGLLDDDPAAAFGFSWVFGADADVTVKATDGAGRSAVVTAQIKPYSGNLAPLAQWIVLPPGFPDPAADGRQDPLLLAGRSSTLDGYGTDLDSACCLAYAWDADGDGDFDDATGNSVGHVFSAGEHTVGLRVTDADGDASTVRRTFSVGTHPPKASLRVDGPDVASTSTDEDGDALDVAWDLDGDREFDDATGPSARALAGEHLVGVRAMDPSGEIGVAYAKVTGQAPPPPGPVLTPPAPVTVARDTTAPSLTASAKAPRLATLLKRGLPVRVRCSEACRAVVVATMIKATAKRRALGSPVGVARSTRALRAGAGATITLRLSPTLRKRLRRVRSLKVALTASATDASGNRAVATRSLRIRR
jgi:PKD domain